MSRPPVSGEPRTRPDGAGHRFDGEHDCFVADCKSLATELAMAQALLRTAASEASTGALDVERLAATEWVYDTMPESFDVIRDPVAAWNDHLYPATDHDKERYRRRARVIAARLAEQSDV